MRSYPFINDLFKNVLSKSKGIDGRFYVCPDMGVEINTNFFNQLLSDEVNRLKIKKYPACLMMPPSSSGDYTTKSGEWEQYQFILFFLTSSFYVNSANSNQIKNHNPDSRTSTHTIPQDWHDMKRCATNFLSVLGRFQKSAELINSSFRLEQGGTRRILPVSNIGADRLAGVRLDFRASLFTDCVLEDYNLEDLGNIEIPVADSHPEHKL